MVNNNSQNMITEDRRVPSLLLAFAKDSLHGQHNDLETELIPYRNKKVTSYAIAVAPLFVASDLSTLPASGTDSTPRRWVDQKG
jgi:hypothetical protein